MCLRPLHFFRSDIPDGEGKYPGFITGYQAETAYYRDFVIRKIPATHHIAAEPVIVPCGKCAECKSSFRRRWVGRAIAESSTCKYTYFLTLTYDDHHLIDKPSKREIQLFLKRFRKYYSFRYLAVGELGTLSDRSHYHLIVFMNDPLPDLTLLRRSKKLPLYTCPILEKCWCNGFSSVGIGSPSSSAYTLGYIVSNNKKSCFKLQSQGLGFEFFKDLKDRYILSNEKGREFIVGLPRYLKEKYKIDCSIDQTLLVKSFANELFNSGLAEYDYRDLKEYLTNSKLII